MVFLVGVFCTLLVMTQLVTGAELPSGMWFLAMLMGLGLLLVLLGLLGNARRRSRAVRRGAVAASPRR